MKAHSNHVFFSQSFQKNNQFKMHTVRPQFYTLIRYFCTYNSSNSCKCRRCFFQDFVSFIENFHVNFFTCYYNIKQILKERHTSESILKPQCFILSCLSLLDIAVCWEKFHFLPFLFFSDFSNLSIKMDNAIVRNTSFLH